MIIFQTNPTTNIRKSKHEPSVIVHFVHSVVYVSVVLEILSVITRRIIIFNFPVHCGVIVRICGKITWVGEIINW